MLHKLLFSSEGQASVLNLIPGLEARPSAMRRWGPSGRLILQSMIAAVFVATALGQQQPVVSNVQVGQRAGTKLVDITYDLTYSGGPVTVWVDVSSDSGRSYVVPAKTFSGHIGQGVTPGNNRAIVWNAEADFDGLLVEQMRVRINTRAGTVPIPPPGMVLIPGGHFQMGEWVDGSSGGTRTVYTSAIFMDRYEVTGALYMEVREWALQNGYSMNAGGARASDHPIHSVNWYDAVKWCNARSEKEGLTPVYYTNESHTTIYRSGNVDVTIAMVKWGANGYRLPTEAEWEKAARGGLSGNTYPWGSGLDQSMANYNGVSPSYQHPWAGFGIPTTPVGYYNGGQIPNGNDMANGFGLYDVVGNIGEWCWDWHGALLGETNPRGPITGSYRILRGGSWATIATASGCAYRYSYGPLEPSNNWGFRCVRGH